MSIVTAPWQSYAVTQGYGKPPPGNPFGEPAQFGHPAGWHDGIDYDVPSGTPVHAPFAGTVVFAGEDETGYGNKVSLQRADGWLVFYAHLGEIDVQDGDQVAAGHLLGTTDNSGHSTGPHLHLGAHDPNGRTADAERLPAGPGDGPGAVGASADQGPRPRWRTGEVDCVQACGVRPDRSSPRWGGVGVGFLRLVSRRAGLPRRPAAFRAHRFVAPSSRLGEARPPGTGPGSLSRRARTSH